MLSEQEVWVRAYCAVLQAMMTSGAWTPAHVRAMSGAKADDALQDFRERFPVAPLPDVLPLVGC
jgi:hypothetical protein